jgi:hypothetical protein
MHMTPTENVLSRLEGVRKRQPGQWSARCPAHADKSPSLSVREAATGAVLLHCFGGCAVGEVVAALGMDLSDLFPPIEKPTNAPQRTPRLFTAGQALELLGDEAILVAVAAGNLAQGVTLSEDDRQRCLKAAGRIATIRTEVMP